MFCGLTDCSRTWQVWLLKRAPRVRLLDMRGLNTPDDWGFEHEDAVWEAWECLDPLDCPVERLDLRVERDGCAKIGLLERYASWSACL